MEIKDIKNKSTLKQVQRLNIDISKFDDYKQLTRHIRLINVKENQKKYLTQKPDYYRNYMREKYRKKVLSLKGFLRPYNKKNQVTDITSIENQIQKLQSQLENLKLKNIQNVSGSMYDGEEKKE